MQGAVDIACGYGGGLRRMEEVGNNLLSGAEKEGLGLLVLDVTSSPASYIAENGDTAAKFLKVTAEVNAMWNFGENTAEMLTVIAKDTGMDEAGAKNSLATFKFPSIEEQFS